jgi:presenilin-like A22 family membrane protease
MKHPANITFLLLGMFLLSQLIGLLIMSQYLESGQALPLGLVRPEMSDNAALLLILVGISIGTISLLGLIRFHLKLLIRLWMFLSIVVMLTVSLSAFIAPLLAFALSIILAIFKIFRFNAILHNLSELFIYGAIAVLFSPILNIPAAIGLLAVISLYDIFAVWKSRHMVYMAKGLMDLKYFPGIFVPYKIPEAKVSGKKTSGKTAKSGGAILGGGDMAFPLIFSGVVLQGLLASHTLFESLLLTAIIPVFATLGLAALFAISKKEKFYPAMPFVTVGCLVGYLIIMLI